ncbi:MAG: winged helix-turn-helix transcriptional regulator [Candidatus Riflebacteria bacterium]|nr:winged helix-turn-helix transcriptional regulator [Candidatus Riflebacteria bacterium]
MIKEPSSKWTFLTNHAHVLLCLAKAPDMLMRDLAIKTGITERAVQRIIAELAEEGYVDIERSGRRNTYKTHGEKNLKHPVESHRHVADLLLLIENNPTMGLTET